ncbi:uncharacterized protein C8orf76 homolog isoform X5 [Camelus bactrianus]|uniref:Uncharacterized protein C8orf76 homolog isoform X5 n=1 Tax=Camelus bactrianus TaxID=9837 RepID=A0AC58PGF9_CAMBA
MESGCWLLGGEFEDSVFEERRERRLEPPVSYCAKRCEPQWFYEETGSSDDVEALTVQKFKGDLAYRRREYQKALQEYSSISEKLPSTNFAMKRDVQEGQARCLVHLGRHQEALEIATNLENKATNTDHLTTVLYLQFAICSSLQNLEKTIFCLQKLISLHPFNPWNWGKLAEAYLNLEPVLSASFASSQKQNNFTLSDKTIKSSFPHSGKDCLLCFSETSPKRSVFSMEASSSNNQKNEKALKNIQSCMAEERAAVLLETQMKACASYVRTRLLLQFAQTQQTSFALERNLRTQQEIEDKMKGFSFKEDTLLLIAEKHPLPSPQAETLRRLENRKGRWNTAGVLWMPAGGWAGSGEGISRPPAAPPSLSISSIRWWEEGHIPLSLGVTGVGHEGKACTVDLF